MSTSARATFAIGGWDEQPYEEAADGRKLTRATVEQTFSGDIEGDGSVQWLMAYRPDGTADFVGLQRITGAFGERSGRVVLSSSGTFDGQVARGTLTVLDGSGTDGLEGIAGSGSFEAPMGGEPVVTLEYDL